MSFSSDASSEASPDSDASAWDSGRRSRFLDTLGFGPEKEGAEPDSDPEGPPVEEASAVVFESEGEGEVVDELELPGSRAEDEGSVVAGEDSPDEGLDSQECDDDGMALRSGSEGPDFLAMGSPEEEPLAEIEPEVVLGGPGAEEDPAEGGFAWSSPATVESPLESGEGSEVESTEELVVEEVEVAESESREDSEEVQASESIHVPVAEMVEDTLAESESDSEGATVVEQVEEATEVEEDPGSLSQFAWAPPERDSEAVSISPDTEETIQELPEEEISDSTEEGVESASSEGDEPVQYPGIIDIACPDCGKGLSLRKEHLGIAGHCVWCETPIVACEANIEKVVRVFQLKPGSESSSVALPEEILQARDSLPLLEDSPEEIEKPSGDLEEFGPETEAGSAEIADAEESSSAESSSSFEWAMPEAESPGDEEAKATEVSLEDSGAENPMGGTAGSGGLLVDETPEAEQKEEDIIENVSTSTPTEEPSWMPAAAQAGVEEKLSESESDDFDSKQGSDPFAMAASLGSDTGIPVDGEPEQEDSWTGLDLGGVSSKESSSPIELGAAFQGPNLSPESESSSETNDGGEVGSLSDLIARSRSGESQGGGLFAAPRDFSEEEESGDSSAPGVEDLLVEDDQESPGEQAAKLPQPAEEESPAGESLFDPQPVDDLSKTEESVEEGAEEATQEEVSPEPVVDEEAEEVAVSAVASKPQKKKGGFRRLLVGLLVLMFVGLLAVAAGAYFFRDQLFSHWLPRFAPQLAPQEMIPGEEGEGGTPSALEVNSGAGEEVAPPAGQAGSVETGSQEIANLATGEVVDTIPEEKPATANSPAASSPSRAQFVPEKRSLFSNGSLQINDSSADPAPDPAE